VIAMSAGPSRIAIMIRKNDELKREVRHLRAEVKRLRSELRLRTPSVEALLRRRGFRVYKKEPEDDLLVPGEPFRNEYAVMLRKYSFRLFLRDVIKHQDRFTVEPLTRYATARTVRAYVAALVRIGLVDARAVWYISIGAIVIGHVIAVYLAHCVALQAYSDRRAALRSQWPMVALMICYTMTSLWIIAQPIVTTR